MSSGPIVYSFTATYPKDGYCETQMGLGNATPPYEPGNVAFCLLSGIFGIIGLVHSRKNMSTAIMYLYALILGYGITKAAEHAMLMNGFDKIAETMLKFLQALVIAGFAACLRDVPPFHSLPNSVLAAILCTAGIYPAVAIVLSSSLENPWVGWLTFDGIWAIVLIEVIIIWFKRKDYPVLQSSIFNIIWYATGFIILAYICWLIDSFACSPVVARLYLHGWWHIFLAWGFYNCIVLIAYLVADSFNKQPVATFWPSDKFIVLVTVQWQDKECAKAD